jgi:hypothetical protein
MAPQLVQPPTMAPRLVRPPVMVPRPELPPAMASLLAEAGLRGQLVQLPVQLLEPAEPGLPELQLVQPAAQSKELVELVLPEPQWVQLNIEVPQPALPAQLPTPSTGSVRRW